MPVNLIISKKRWVWAHRFYKYSVQIRIIRVLLIEIRLSLYAYRLAHNLLDLLYLYR